jgi:hypothetical protein
LVGRQKSMPLNMALKWENWRYFQLNGGWLA